MAKRSERFPKVVCDHVGKNGCNPECYEGKPHNFNPVTDDNTNRYCLMGTCGRVRCVPSRKRR